MVGNSLVTRRPYGCSYKDPLHAFDDGLSWGGLIVLFNSYSLCVIICNAMEIELIFMTGDKIEKSLTNSPVGLLICGDALAVFSSSLTQSTSGFVT